MRKSLIAVLAASTSVLSAQQSSIPVYEPVPPQPGTSGYGEAMVDTEFFAVRISDELEVDGHLDEKAWEQAHLINDFRFRDGKKPEGLTDLRVLYSPTALYLGVIMYEPNMQGLHARWDQRDQSLWNDDSLEFVIATSPQPEDFFHFLVNPLGTIFDAMDGDRSWNAEGMETGVVQEADRWIVEVKIPFSDMGVQPPLPGEYWGARFCRERHHGIQGAGHYDHSSIPITKQGSYNQRAYLGKLQFATGESSGAWSFVVDQETFLVGYNALEIGVKNEGEESTVRVTSHFYNDQNQPMGETSDTWTLKAGESGTRIMPVVVADDSVARVAVTFANAEGDIVAASVLERGYSYVAPGTRGTQEMAIMLESSLAPFKKVENPVYEGVRSSLQRIQAKLSDYEVVINTAIENQQVVDPELSAAIAAESNGFLRYRDTYRYLYWETSPWEIGDPKALPPASEDYNQLAFDYRQAGNEREIRTFILHGLLTGSRLDLRVVPHSTGGGKKAFLSADQFEVYYEPFVRERDKWITAPLIRAPGNVFTVTPGDSLRVWVVFNSRGVEPGKYETRIDLKPLNDYTIPNQSIPVTAEVWDFAMPETADWPIDCYFWFGQNSPVDEIALMQLLHDYHVNWTMTESINYSYGFREDRSKRNPKSAYDLDRIRNGQPRFFEEAKRLNMKFVFSWGIPHDIEWVQGMSDYLKELGFDYDDYKFHGLLRDEFTAKDIPAAAAIRKKVSEINPGWSFMATYLSAPPPTGASLELLEESGIADFYDTWSVIRGRMVDPKNGPETLKFLKKEKGNTVWAYQCLLNMQTLPVLDYYRFSPWEAFQNGWDGVAWWSSSSSRGDDGFDHREVGYNDGITWRGLDKKPIPTKRLEAVREGLEDVAYMDILTTLLDKAENAPASKLPLKKYRSLVNEVPLQLMESRSQEGIDAWRIEMGEAIVALQKHLKRNEKPQN